MGFCRAVMWKVVTIKAKFNMKIKFLNVIPKAVHIYSEINTVKTRIVSDLKLLNGSPTQHSSVAYQYINHEVFYNFQLYCQRSGTTILKIQFQPAIPKLANPKKNKNASLFKSCSSIFYLKTCTNALSMQYSIKMLLSKIPEV